MSVRLLRRARSARCAAPLPEALEQAKRQLADVLLSRRIEQSLEGSPHFFITLDGLGDVFTIRRKGLGGQQCQEHSGSLLRPLAGFLPFWMILYPALHLRETPRSTYY